MSTEQSKRRAFWTAALVLTLGSYGVAGHAAAQLVIRNTNAPGVGFNDPTPAAPVGGNTGRTLGQQRLNAFMAAAAKWGATITSTSQIVIDASFAALPCTATDAVLGSAGPQGGFRDFPGARVANTFYPSALANKQAGGDLDPTTSEIRAQFNVNLGQPNCVPGLPFYLGLDNNHGTSIDLYTVLLHEFGHGLGFTTFTNGQTGAQANGFPTIFDLFVYDSAQHREWVEMTDAQRATSAITPRQVVWTGSKARAAAARTLRNGTPKLTVRTPASVSGEYLVGAAEFGPPLAIPGLSGQVGRVTGSGCSALNAADTAAIQGKIALVDRNANCNSIVLIKNAQSAGAIGVIVAEIVAGSPPPPIRGTDNTVTVPAVRISQADGNRLKTAIASATVNASLGISPASRSGTDTLGRVILNTPNPFQPGSSVAHWDPIASRNLLMEPADSGDLTHELIPPNDITFPMLQDLGW